LVFVNPFGGKGKANGIWNEEVRFFRSSLDTNPRPLCNLNGVLG